AQGLESSEIHLYRLCRDATFGDMYSHLRTVEVTLHRLVRQTLQQAYSSHDDECWHHGVPLPIRQRCVSVREADPQHLVDPYVYTNLIDLKEIIEKNWVLFVDILPSEASRDKRELGRMFDRLNRIRNVVMHPVKQVHPTEDDFTFV